MATSHKAVSLVLSIFKGENFVNTQLGSFKFQLQATCNGKMMESNVVQAVPSNSEPAIQSQLAWTFTRQEFRRIRTNREVVKVCCMIVHDDGRKTDMGYAVMHVRDAFELKSFDEIDPSKAKAVPLHGTKANWLTCHAKLHMSLHIEGAQILPQLLSSIVKKPAGVLKPSELKKDAEQDRPVPVANISKKPTTPVMEEISRKTERLNLNIPKEPTPKNLEWRINESEGYFELGEPSEHDDYYIVNITIISASNLHSLWNGRTSRKQPALDEHVWQIRYKAYGCEIKSDPFVLSSNDETRRTFIGDKATARIRANPIAWISYLDSSFVEFQVVRYRLSSDNQLIDEEVMGFSCAELKDLADPNISELKALLEINSEWGYPQNVDPENKPEVRVVFEVDAIPEFFADKRSLPSNQDQAHEDHSDGRVNSALQNDFKQNEDLVAKNDDAEFREIIEQIKEMELTGANQQGDSESSRKTLKGVEQTDRRKEDSKEKTGKILKQTNNIHERFMSPLTSRKPVEKSQSVKGKELDDENDFTSCANINFINENPPESKKAKLSAEFELQSQNKDSEQNDDIFPQIPVSPEVEIISTEISATSISDTEGDKENVEQILPKPGEYKVIIELRKFFLCSKNTIEDTLMLSYIHPLFGLKEAVNLNATPSITKKRNSGVNQYFEITDAACTLTYNFQKFSDPIINEPLTINFKQCDSDKSSSNTFAFCMLPIGSVFLQEQDDSGIRKLSNSVEILKSGTNFTIGKLYFNVGARIASQRSRLPSSHPRHRDIPSLSKDRRFSPTKYLKPSEELGAIGATGIDQELVFHTIQDLNRWRAEQERLFLETKKNKEQAYLRILAEENQKREQEREKMTADKFREYKIKEKEYYNKLKQIADQEEKLKKYEVELSTAAHKSSLKHATVLENTRIHIHRMREEHQIEVSSLQRRLEESESELVKLKGKLTILERRLEEKEENIAKLKQERYSGSEAKLAEGLRTLEQENAILRREKSEVEKSRDKYKKQSQALCFKLSRLQDDLDKQVKDENESLRLQILASKEHKELKKERKAVTELSERIKQIKDTSKPKEDQGAGHSGGVGNNFSSARSRNEEEIRRLNDQRNGLLNTGAYTQFDMVIKEMERRIVQLAKGDSDDK